MVSAEELPFDTVLTLYAQTGDNLDALRRFVEKTFGGEIRCDGSILTNARQFGALTRAEAALVHGQKALTGGMTPDAVLTDVEEAMEALGEVTGHTIREDITNRIFERFCVGK